MLGGTIACSAAARAADSQPAQEARKAPQAERQRPGRGANAQSRLDAMATQLGLSEDQKTKLVPILKEQGEKIRAVRQEQGLSQEQQREKMKAIRDEFQPKFKKILTPEQFDKWQKSRTQGARGQGPRGQGARRSTGGAGGAGGAVGAGDAK
jgi:Spy/CpxP family protein refolding chaperone